MRNAPPKYLAIAAGVVALTTIGAAWNPLRFRYVEIVLNHPIVGVVVVAALTAGALRGVPKRKWTQTLARISVVALSAAALLSIAGVVVLSAIFGSAETQHVKSPDGQYELVIQEFTAVVDPGWDVVLRTGWGPFTRESLVLRKVDGSPPTTLRFTGDREVEIITADGASYRSTFDRWLDVSPVHCLNKGYC